jgi:hypothetical protein
MRGISAAAPYNRAVKANLGKPGDGAGYCRGFLSIIWVKQRARTHRGERPAPVVLWKADTVPLRRLMAALQIFG